MQQRVEEVGQDSLPAWLTRGELNVDLKDSIGLLIEIYTTCYLTPYLWRALHLSRGPWYGGLRCAWLSTHRGFPTSRGHLSSHEQLLLPRQERLLVLCLQLRLSICSARLPRRWRHDNIWVVVLWLAKVHILIQNTNFLHVVPASRSEMRGLLVTCRLSNHSSPC